MPMLKFLFLSVSTKYKYFVHLATSDFKEPKSKFNNFFFISRLDLNINKNTRLCVSIDYKTFPIRLEYYNKIKII